MALGMMVREKGVPKGLEWGWQTTLGEGWVLRAGGD